MAWWTTQFVFHDDTLISEGVNPIQPDHFELVVNGQQPPVGSERYTLVVVSGYALYGELRGYYALGVAHWFLDRPGGRVYMSEASQRHSEPVSSLSSTQRALVRACLVDISSSAWETSNLSFRRALQT
jgi:hypothetical protein